MAATAARARSAGISGKKMRAAEDARASDCEVAAIDSGPLAMEAALVDSGRFPEVIVSGIPKMVIGICGGKGAPLKGVHLQPAAPRELSGGYSRKPFGLAGELVAVGIAYESVMDGQTALAVCRPTADIAAG